MKRREFFARQCLILLSLCSQEVTSVLLLGGRAASVYRKLPRIVIDRHTQFVCTYIMFIDKNIWL